ncbi:LacI family DNA-binding transcriptional regulator [Saccharopolyspora oryzae]|uniref:LacI family DNA-binding transcriptional regulator n=1 Tax=Saccharopolyspora oryzae TaxID=2997343 RepID=A0ABT4UVH9_9PSEU|nr:LacI family DNA-binding transcriptional regulator [Saccharopolyspora oryzae]MDA3625718.1 LacI family DNA-binding transcriptional regulator [Saccharopolyspora oryzae]
MTLRDVAEKAGVSRATASLVLRGTGRVSDATRERVEKAMSDLGYVYDRVAASLRTQRGQFVGVVITNIGNPFFSELFKGLEAGLLRAGYVPLLASTSDDVEQQDAVLTGFHEHQVAGLALVPATGSDQALVDRLTAWGIGHVLLTRYLGDARLTYVGADDVLGGRLAGEHLVRHGARKFAYVGGFPQMLSRRDRLTGLRQAVEEAGLDPDDVIDLPGRVSGAGGLELGRDLLDRGELPDAVLCHSDSVALGLFRAMHDKGRTDVRVIGYDGIADAALWEPPLTSVAVHPGRLGERAAEMLLSRMAGPKAAPDVELAEPELVIRRSCGCGSEG